MQESCSESPILGWTGLGGNSEEALQEIFFPWGTYNENLILLSLVSKVKQSLSGGLDAITPKLVNSGEIVAHVNNFNFRMSNLRQKRRIYGKVERFN